MSEVTVETGWLIEKQIGGRAVWWRLADSCGRDYTVDASEAIRFARKTDAERVAMFVLDDFWHRAIATEHSWTTGV